MELLDLDQHDPEEYSGKSIIFNGCHYIIGDLVGMGAEKIVHKLTNKQSGLSLHLIKIYRSIDPKGKYGIIGDPYQTQAQLYNIVPWMIRLDGFGDWAVIVEKSLSTSPLESNNYIEKLTDRADSLAGDEKYEDSVTVYSEILKLNPWHAHALHNMGVAVCKIDDYQTGYTLLRKAIVIEPNYPKFYETIFMIAASCGYLYLALQYYESMKSIFPFECNLDEMAISLYLEAGHPEKAIKCLGNSFLLDSEKIYQKRQTIEDADIARKRAMSIVEAMEVTALQRLKETGIFVGVEALGKAYREYDKDTILAANYGLALMQENQPLKGKEILLAQINRDDPFLDTICLINAALCDIYAKQFEDAVELLSTAMTYLKKNSKGEEVSFVDVPGCSLYIRELQGRPTAIENPGRSVELIEHLIEGCPRPTPKVAQFFLRVYKQMVDAQQQNK